MANGRLVVDCVRLQKAGAELINIVESLKEKLLHQPRQKNKWPKHFTQNVLVHNQDFH